MSNKALVVTKLSFVLFSLFLSVISYGQPICSEPAFADYPLCSGSGAPTIEVNIAEKVYTIFMGDVDLDFTLNNCDTPCMGNNGNAPPPSMGNAMTVDEVLDETGVSVGITPVDNLPFSDFSMGTNGDYTVTWSPNLAPGTYTVTITVCVCFDNAGGDESACCATETFTFILCVIQPVPTMTQWGLFLFALLTVNLGLIFVYHKHQRLEY